MSNKKKMKSKKKGNLQVTDASSWNAKKDAGPLELPSGNVALVKAPGMDTFLKEKFIPNSLLPYVTAALEGKRPEMEKMEEDVKSTEQLNEMLELMDRVTCYCVLEPVVKMVPLDDEGNKVPPNEREQGVLYIDQVDLEDKSFIFQFAVGGTRDLEQFREGINKSLGSVSASEAVASPTE